MSSFIRHRKPLQKGMRITSTDGGDTISNSIRLPNSGRTNVTGSDSKGRAYTRNTSHVAGIGSKRDTSSRSPVNNPTRVKQTIGKNSDNSSALTRQRTLLSGPGKSRPLFALKKRTVKAPSLVRRVARNILNRALNI